MTEQLKAVRVSEDTRRNARVAPTMKFESYSEEWDYWVSRKKDVEAKLSGYSKAAFAAAQHAVRKNTTGKRSFDAWIATKSRMEQERRELIEQKNEAEQELLRLKRLVAMENQRASLLSQQAAHPAMRDNGTVCYSTAILTVLDELAAIRVLLEKLTSRE